TEHEVVAGLEPTFGQAAPAPGAQREQPLGPRRLEVGGPAGMDSDGGVLVVVEPRAAQPRIVEREAERLHQVPACPAVGAHPDDVAGVGRDLGRYEDDVEHGDMVARSPILPRRAGRHVAVYVASSPSSSIPGAGVRANARRSRGSPPAARAALSASRIVAPVVMTSSTRTSALPASAAEPAMAPWRLSPRAPRASPGWGRVSRVRTSPATMIGMPQRVPTCRASTAAWSNPRRASREGAIGTATRAVPSGNGCARRCCSSRLAMAAPMARPRAMRRPYLKAVTSRSAGGP